MVATRSTFCLVQTGSEAENSQVSTIAATEFLPLVATAVAATDSIVVSLHDVASSTQQIANTIISELACHGVRVCSILVVPDYHHEGLFAKDPQFVSWLRGLEADGHEIVLAGETGTILVFVVGLCPGRPDQLDRRAQLCCEK